MDDELFRNRCDTMSGTEGGFSIILKVDFAWLVDSDCFRAQWLRPWTGLEHPEAEMI